MNGEFDTFGLVLRMRQMVYSSKDFNLKLTFVATQPDMQAIWRSLLQKLESLCFFSRYALLA